MKPVLYNNGGFVAHVAVKVDAPDSFNALVEAANIAGAYDGRVEALYQDSKFGQRTRVLGTERAGLVLEPGTLDDRFDLAREVDRLRAGLEEYLLWEPRRAGHAEAHRKLASLIREET